MSSYARHLEPKATPQTKPIAGTVANSSGGFSFKVDSWTRLERFLVLGSEGGSYYAGERELTLDNAECVVKCFEADASRTIAMIVDISEKGRCLKNDTCIFALAICAAHKHWTSGYALNVLSKVCRTGTHLFQFVEAVTKMRGWGRALRSAVANWYLKMDADKLAYQVTKYQSREGWSHRDLLRLSHPTPRTAGHKDVFQYIAQREKWQKSTRAGTRMLVFAEEAKTASNTRLTRMIREEGLAREHIPTERLDQPSIWSALLDAGMPATAMLRNLNKLTEVGVLAPLSSGTNTVCERLRDPEYLKHGRLHPFNVLVALKTYASGHGFRGSKTWTPVPEVVAALEDAFYLSFGAIEPTGKRHLFGIDVSGSMGAAINNTNVSCRSAAACLAMLGVKTEPRSYAFGFTNTFRDLGITARDRLDEVEQKVHRSDFGSTDCAVPMVHALKHKLEVDAFVVLTDSETYAGRIHPTQALEEYRQKTGINAKLIVVGMVSNAFTVADPKDSRQMDVVGFDTSAPQVMADFIRSR